MTFKPTRNRSDDIIRHLPWFQHYITDRLNKISGAKNHKYFIGFLACLVIMCSQMLFGAFSFWKNDPQCNALDERANRTFWETLLAIEQCDTWVAWVSVNAAFHGIWVFMLLICQLYQVCI